MSSQPEQELSLQEMLAVLRSEEQRLSGILESGEGNFAETFLLLEQVRSEINALIDEIPSAGPSGMTGEASVRVSRGPEPDRWKE